MQHASIEIKEKLLSALDQEYNVVDFPAVLEVIGILEGMTISKEYLELTRLGRCVNELRRRTTDESLARRCKKLIIHWKTMFKISDHIPHENLNHTRDVPKDPCRSTRTRTGRLISPALPGPHYSSVKRTSPITITLDSSPRSHQSSTSTSPGLAPCSPSNSSLYITSSRLVSPSVAPRSPAISPALARYKPSSPSVSALLARVTPKVSPKSPIVSAGSIVNAVHSKFLSISNRTSPTSSYTPSVDAVPRTNAANKRLRKDDSPLLEPDRKRMRNSVVPNGLDVLVVVDDHSQDGVSSAVDAGSVKVPSRREPSEIRKKRKKRVGTDVLKEQIASVTRTPKVRTTEQILADLAKHSGSPSLALKAEEIAHSNCDGNSSLRRPSRLYNSSVVKEISEDELNSNKNELLEKFLKSHRDMDEMRDNSRTQSPNSEPVPSPNTRPESARSIDQSVEEILARLPPLDLDSLIWDSDTEEETRPVQIGVTEEQIERLHNEHLPGSNGNVDHSGVFREWHETLTRRSYQGDLLHILPYTIVD